MGWKVRQGLPQRIAFPVEYIQNNKTSLIMGTVGIIKAIIQWKIKKHIGKKSIRRKILLK
jgi:hypothetical protein